MSSAWPLELPELARWLAAQPALEHEAGKLVDALQQHGAMLRHGDLPGWLEALEALPDSPCTRRHLDAAVVAADISPAQQTPARHTALHSALRALSPWRKGPYRIGPVRIDSEWRCDWKWARLAPHITPLSGRTVLDVGCGNGYYLWRMLGAGARTALGIDPGLLFVLQFRAICRLLTPSPTGAQSHATDLPALLPLTLEQFPESLARFDTVFSMGVLYHRRDPLSHLSQLYGALRPGGELVLETLVLPGDAAQTLVPDGRYARMRNVWALPTVNRLLEQLAECGFADARGVSVDVTSTAEQRTTEWMPFQSLADALQPDEQRLTVEGLPRPRRALLLARRAEP